MDTGWVLCGILLIVGALLTFGAQGVMLAGNIMAIVVGASSARIGCSVASIVLGIVGLVAFPVFMADVFTGWAWNIGMFERAVIYPIMIGHVLPGSGLIAARHVSTNNNTSGSARFSHVGSTGHGRLGLHR